jgi:hypothetical protein
VRDPVERAYSAHHHELARGYETEPFERALELEASRLAGEVERLRAEPSYESFSHRHHAYLTRGRYADQLATLAEHGGAGNLLVLDADAFFERPKEHYDRVLSFLGLPSYDRSPLRQTNARPRAPMPESLRSRLRDEFANSDAALAHFLGEVPSWRR